MKTFPVRFTNQANDLLRDAYYYRGDLSSQLTNILEKANLNSITLKSFPTGRAALSVKDEDRPLLKTSVRLSVELYGRVKAIASTRNTSVNSLLNSAVLAALGNGANASSTGRSARFGRTDRVGTPPPPQIVFFEGRAPQGKVQPTATPRANSSIKH